MHGFPARYSRLVLGEISLRGRFGKGGGLFLGDDFPGSTPRPPCHFDEWRACPLARLAEREKARPEGARQPRKRRSEEAESGVLERRVDKLGQAGGSERRGDGAGEREAFCFVLRGESRRRRELVEEGGLSLVCGRVRSFLGGRDGCWSSFVVVFRAFCVKSLLCGELLGGRDGCSRRFVRRHVEPSSFVVDRVLASESALSAAGPCVSGRHVPPGHEPADGTPGKSFFLFHLGFWGVCVCV